MIEISVGGAEEATKVLKMLPPRLARAALLSAVRSGAQVIRKELIASAPRGSSGPRGRNQKYGPLYKNIKTKSVRSKPTEVTISIHTGRAYWGKWVEEGTVERPAVKGKPDKYRIAKIGGRTVKIKTTGRVSPKPWFYPAAERAFPGGAKRMGEVLWDNIQKQINNLTGSFSKFKGRVSKRKQIF